MTGSKLPILPDAIANLPDPVARNAWKALLHFLGGGASYLGEWIRRASQGVSDVTDGRSIVSHMLAEEVGRRAIADPVMIAAAAETLLPGYARKLANRFAVAEQAVFELAVLVPETVEQGRLTGPTEDIDPDWLNNFERFAEDATSEKMQNLWGRVLAGEIKHPGSFCKATLRALYELDADVAEAFESARPHIIADQVLPLVSIFTSKSERIIPMSHLLTLESAGILAGADGMIGWFFDMDEHGRATVSQGPDTLVVFGQPGTRVQVSSQPLSKVGREIAALLPNSDTRGKLEQLGRFLETDPDNKNLIGALIGTFTLDNTGKVTVTPDSGEMLWGRRS